MHGPKLDNNIKEKMMADNYFPQLFKEGQIGNIKTQNRIVMLPMARQFQGFNGEVTQKTINYYVERAKGGVGLIIVGSTRVFPPAPTATGPISQRTTRSQSRASGAGSATGCWSTISVACLTTLITRCL